MSRESREQERPKQEYLDGIAQFEQLLDEMRSRFFSEAGTIKEIKEQLSSLRDYTHNEPTT